MLNSLYIKNFAILKCTSINFMLGMTAITGETGTGKSIILEAIKYASGNRISHKTLLKDNKKPDVSICFDIKHLPKAQQWLDERSIEHDYECIIRRILLEDGRSKGYINHQPCSLSNIKEISKILLNIQNQHSQQLLFESSHQRELLDSYAQCDEQLNCVLQLWNACFQIKKKIKELHESKQAKASRYSLLQYQLEELDALDLKEGEVEMLEKQHKVLAGAEHFQHVCFQCKDMLTEKEGNINQALSTCMSLMQETESFKDAYQLLEEARVLIDEAHRNIFNFEQSIEMNPEKLNNIEQRLSLIHDIARKHKLESFQLFDFHKQLQIEYDRCELNDQAIKEKEEELESLQQELLEQSSKLSYLRVQAAKKMEQEMNAILQKVAMQKTSFHISFERLAVCESFGIDAISFQIHNKQNSKDPMDMSKIASGGELSRINLAIQLVTVGARDIKTLIFDEVDSGIGGAAAEMVGSILRHLGEKNQVLCITHQAQVASQAHQHLFVHQKSMPDKSVTEHTIQTLNRKSREQEVARMLGGVDITEKTLAHAQEMLKRAQNPM